MQIEFRYTKHQTARGARPDNEVEDKLYLIKNVSEMRLTYQIRILADLARRRGQRLVVRLPRQARVHPSLRDFLSLHKETIKTERV